MDFSKKYEQLAAQLGDVTFKLLVLKEKQEELITEIKKLDQLAGLLNGQAEKANTQKHSGGNDSPA